MKKWELYTGAAKTQAYKIPKKQQLWLFITNAQNTKQNPTKICLSHRKKKKIKNKTPQNKNKTKSKKIKIKKGLA